MISSFLASFLRRCFHRLPKVSLKQSSKHISQPSKRSKSTPRKIPPNSWDSHMHILDPHNYPLSPMAHYQPNAHLLPSALAFESSISLPNIVLVQPSIYGYDNSCLLSALRQLGPDRARGVVAFDPKTINNEELEEWHKIGVRGVRVNLQSVGKTVKIGELEEILGKYAELIRPLTWVLQLYVPLATVADLEEIVPKLGIKVCFDHFGSPALPALSEKTVAIDPYSIPGFSSLVKLLEQSHTYVKLSAPYRISRMAGYRDLEPLAKELLEVAGKKKVVFATDWPHTRFEGLDIKPFVEQVIQWCEGDDVLTERLFRGNAEDLWGIS